MATSRAKSKKKRAYHHGDLRRALLDEATALIAREGTAAVSLRELSERVGVSHAAAYRHFANKEALFASVAEEGFRTLKEAEVAARDAAGPDARARLSAIGVAYIGFAVAHTGHFKVMFSHLGTSYSDVPGLAVEGEAAFAVVVEAVAAAQAAGAARGGDVLRLAVFAWASVHGFAHLLIEQALDDVNLGGDTAERARWLVEQVFDGLA
jgi:AcrR family transcriptional regulator